MNKKRIFGIILFIIIGLFTFTFANPNEKVEDDNNNQPQEEVQTPTLDESKIENDNTDIIEPAVALEPIINQKELPQENNTLEELDLNKEKENAIKEIKKYQEDKNLNESEKANKVVEEVTNKINSKSTKEEIEKIKDETKKELDKIREELDLINIKNKAIEEVKNYKKEELYSEENNRKVEEIKKEAINKINDANEKEEVEKIKDEAKKEIDSILTLKETSYNVKFINLKEEIVKEEKVLYGKSAEAPDMNNIEINGITYKFTTWDEDYTNVTSNLIVKANYEITQVIANIYENDLIGTVKLNITDKIKEVILNNTNTVITTNENDIINLSSDNLPILNKLNYKYNYYELSYTLSEGFIIKVKEIIDEKSLEENTVTITYNIDSNIATFLNGTKQFKSTTYTGINMLELPKVYIDKQEVAVIWTDEKGNIISKISENKIDLINELEYNKSTNLTATLDTTAPVITLKGDKLKNVDLTFEDEYKEEGYNAIDNFNGDITSYVTTSIALNGVSTNQVNYSVEGTYVITYTVSDTEGNITSETRTIIVRDKVKELTATIYALNDDITNPSEKDSDYHIIGEVNLIVDKVRSYLNKDLTIANSDIASYIVGGESSLPKLNEKYYSYEYYILKSTKEGFRIDCKKVFDSELYKNDKLKELNELLNKDYTIYEQTKTNNTYKNLINTVSEIKNNMPTTIEKIEESIKKINDAVAQLVDVVLIDIKLSRNNDKYIVNSTMNSLTLTAIYNDTTKNKVLNKEEYTTNTTFDSTTIGNKSITYSYKNKKVVYNYVVEYSSEQLQAKVNKVEPNLKEKITLSKIEYKLIFNNLPSDVSIKNINVTKNNKVLKTINLNKISHDTYTMNRDEYFTLVNNNTTIRNKKINITYKIGNQEITVSYYEAFNKLYKCK